MADEKPLSLPGSSWDTVKKIIRAFSAAQAEKSPTVEKIAKLAGVQRPVVSMNNNFLRSVGIVRADDWKLTETGLRYATGLEMRNESMASENLAEAVRGNPTLLEVLNVLRARGEMKTSTLKGEVIIRLGISTSDRQALFVKPLFEMMQEAGLIEFNGDAVKLASMHGQRVEAEAVTQPLRMVAQQESHSTETIRLPLPLGPNRLAYVELPSDWDKKELSKLLKLLEISLGDEV